MQSKQMWTARSRRQSYAAVALSHADAGPRMVARLAAKWPGMPFGLCLVGSGLLWLAPGPALNAPAVVCGAVAWATAAISTGATVASIVDLACADWQGRIVFNTAAPLKPPPAEAPADPAETRLAEIAKAKADEAAQANQEAAQAYLNLGNIAALHDTGKARVAYARSRELDPDAAPLKPPPAEAPADQA